MCDKTHDATTGVRVIALTGASGFVGAALLDGFLADEKVRVKALARTPSKLAPWAGASADRLEIIKGALDDNNALRRLADGADVFVHGAGVTHATDDADYHRINVEGAARAASAAYDAGAALVHLSSLSARAPGLSPYAASKRQSEEAVAHAGAVCLRLPAIYGPHDMATLPYFRLIRRGLALEPATRPPARASLLFVEDAAGAVRAAAADTRPAPGVYDVSDDSPDGHAWREIGRMLGQVMGKSPRAIRVPRPIIAAHHGAERLAARLFQRMPAVRTGQINEFFHPDWVARDNLFSEAAGWAPKNSLQEGFAKTLRWYQENGYL